MNLTLALTISFLLALMAHLIARLIINRMARSKSDEIKIKTKTGNIIYIPGHRQLSDKEIDVAIEKVTDIESPNDVQFHPRGWKDYFTTLYTKTHVAVTIALIVFSATALILGGPGLMSKYREWFGPSRTPAPDSLIDIIKEQQRINVKQSTGSSADDSFTDADLQKFIHDRVPDRIAQELKRNDQFLNVVLAIKEMPPTEREQLLNKALGTFKPTWAQIGRISPEGQTEAGQMAEIMIAEAIVNVVKEIYLRPVEEIKKHGG